MFGSGGLVLALAWAQVENAGVMFGFCSSPGESLTMLGGGGLDLAVAWPLVGGGGIMFTIGWAGGGKGLGF